MRSLLSAALALFLSVAAASAGSMLLLRVGVNSTGVSLPALTYIGSTAATMASPIATVTGASIGTASAGRLVVAVVTAIPAGMTTLSMTIDSGGGPVSMNTGPQNFGGTFGSACSIYYLNVASGTTATFVSTSNGGAGFQTFDVYTVTGLSSFTPVGSSANGNASASTLSTTLATTSGGVIIQNSMQGAGGSSATDVVGGTETFTTDNPNFVVSASGRGSVASATNVATNASSSISGTWVGATDVSICGASWR